MPRTITTTTPNKNAAAAGTDSQKRDKSPTSTPASAVSSSSNQPINIAILETILGKALWRKSEKLDKIVSLPIQEALGNKEFIALYFGAQWSSVSTQFTPQLVDFYQQANAMSGCSSSSKKKANTTLEVVYISSDQTQQEFERHFGIMPSSWLTMVSDTPESLKMKNDMIPLFKAFRIPSLVLLHGPTGRFITEHGVKEIQQCGMSTITKNPSKNDDRTTTMNAANHDAMNGAVTELLQQWRTAHHTTIQDAHTLIDYGGGIMSALLLLYRNPYIIVAIIAITISTPILKLISHKPMVLIGFMYLFKRHLTPKGDQNIPGQLLTVTTVLTNNETKHMG